MGEISDDSRPSEKTTNCLIEKTELFMMSAVYEFISDWEKWQFIPISLLYYYSFHIELTLNYNFYEINSWPCVRTTHPTHSLLFKIQYISVSKTKYKYRT